MEGVAATAAAEAGGIDFVDLCAEDELWDGDMDSFDVGRHEVLLVRYGGRYYAYDAICPHQSTSLADGELTEDGVIICGAHLWEFRADSGQGINPANECLKTFPVKVEDGRVFVGAEPDAT